MPTPNEMKVSFLNDKGRKIYFYLKINPNIKKGINTNIFCKLEYTRIGKNCFFIHCFIFNNHFEMKLGKFFIKWTLFH